MEPSIGVTNTGSHEETKPSLTDFDLTISRYGLVPKTKELYNKQPLPMLIEFQLKQIIVKEIKVVMSFPIEILKLQHYYWLSFIPIEDEKQRSRLKIAIESFCKTPVEWISHNELQINIHPDERLITKQL